MDEDELLARLDELLARRGAKRGNPEDTVRPSAKEAALAQMSTRDRVLAAVPVVEVEGIDEPTGVSVMNPSPMISIDLLLTDDLDESYEDDGWFSTGPVPLN
jgi:hypothetical protein